ncbi:MAG: hypothetical protein NTZ97_03490 [Candidatus Moranbacteria bacterium]|nr:hypothetical protein [Candidatus Moranbacteria bacterium]
MIWRWKKAAASIDFDKLNHVLPGQEIAINPDGMEIKEVPGFSGTETLDSKGFSLMKKVYGLNIDNWRQIKNLTWDKVQGQLSPDSETYKNIQKLIAEQGKTLGEAAKPQSNETIPTWVARLAKLSVNK